MKESATTRPMGAAATAQGLRQWLTSAIDLRERTFRISADFIFASVLTGVAAFLYLSLITAASLWSDEGLTAWVMERHARPFLSHIIFEAPHYALYYLVLRSFVELAGTSEVALRSLSIASAVATVPFVYLIGLRLAPGRFVAAAASLLLVANGFVLHFAVEARAYPFVMLLVTAASWLLLVAAERPRALHWIAYAIVMTAAIWAHFYAFFLLPAHVAWVWFQGGAVRRQGLVAVSGCLAGAVPIGLMIVAWTPSRAWLDAPALGQIGRMLADVAGASGPGWLGPVLPLAYLAGTAVAFIAWMRRGRSPLLALTLLWIATPIVVGLIVTVVKPVFIARSLIIIAPALALALAFALRQLRPRWLAATTLALVVMLSAQHLSVTRLGHHDFRSAMATVAEQAGPGDAFLHVPPFAHMWMTPRYYLRHSPVADDVELLNGVRLRPRALEERIAALARSRERIWLLVERNPDGRQPHGAKKWLRRIAAEGYEPVTEWSFLRLRLVLFAPGQSTE